MKLLQTAENGKGLKTEFYLFGSLKYRALEYNHAGQVEREINLTGSEMLALAAKLANYGWTFKDAAEIERIKARLEELRQELQAERISYGELAELQKLKIYIDPADVELLEAAGVEEFPND